MFRNCQYIHNGPDDADWPLFCGAPVEEGRPYCPAHARLCYRQPGEDWENGADAETRAEEEAKAAAYRASLRPKAPNPLPERARAWTAANRGQRLAQFRKARSDKAKAKYAPMIAAVRQGETAKAVAERFGVPAGSLGLAIQKYAPDIAAERKRAVRDKYKTVWEAMDKGESLRSIAARTGMSYGAVRHTALKKP